MIKKIIDDLKKIKKTTIINCSAKNHYWKMIQKNYSIEDNRKSKAHLVAARHGYLPIIKWILEHNPESIHDTNKDGNDLINIAIQSKQFDVLNYLNPQSDYRTKDGQILLHPYIVE